MLTQWALLESGMAEISATTGVLSIAGTSGLSAGAAAAATSMGVGGAAISGGGFNAGQTAATTGFGVGLEGIVGGLQSRVGGGVVDIAARIGSEAGIDAGLQIVNLSDAAFSSWAMGIGTFISGMVSGKGFVRSAAGGLGAAGGAYLGAKGGAAIGSYFPVVGTAVGGLVGGVVGGILGALGIDKLFGGGENKFTLTELVQKDVNAQIFDKLKGFEAKNYTAALSLTDWYQPIANAYAASIETVQQSFDKIVFDFTDKLPVEMQKQILDTLSNTDYVAMLTGASAGRWKISDAQAVITAVAQNYANALAKNLGDAYANALADYVSTKGAAGLIGDTHVWSMLSQRIQDNINYMFTAIAAQIKGGDTEGGLKAINDINAVINKIGAAMAPITEIIATKGMTDYELQLRAINKQFDNYGKALQDAGVDLIKYTDLETARQIELAKAAETAANSVDSLAQSLLDQHKSITQWLAELNVSTLAPVQSQAAMTFEYNRLKAVSLGISATEADTTDYLNYAKEYLTFMRTYGTGNSYQDIYSKVVTDAEALRSSIDNRIPIENQQLAALLAIERNTSSLVDIPSHAEGIGYVPRNNYLAKLHQGERVQTAQEARGSAERGNNGEVIIHSHIYLDGKEIQTSVSKGFRTNRELIDSARRAVN